MPTGWITYDFATCRHCARDIQRAHGTEKWLHATFAERCWPATSAEPKP